MPAAGCNQYQVPGQALCFNAAKGQHSQSHNVLLVDLDGDGDQDVLDGRDNCPELTRLINQGTNQTASFPPHCHQQAACSRPLPTRPAPSTSRPAIWLMLTSMASRIWWWHLTFSIISRTG